MVPPPAGIPLEEFAVRLLEAPGANAWYVALVPPGDEVAAARALVEEANAIEPDFAIQASLVSPEDFIAAARGAPYRLIVAEGFDSFDASAWATLDVARSRLMREDGVTALVLTPTAFGLLQNNAPNLASVIGGAAFELAPPTAPSSEERLEQLRVWGGMSDDEFIARVEAGSIEPDPFVAEWLVLLGRGDLLEQR